MGMIMGLPELNSTLGKKVADPKNQLLIKL